MGHLTGLTGLTALVTGAGRGVGRQVALDLATGGVATVLVNDFFADRAETVAAEVRATGVAAQSVPFDVTDFEAVQSAVSAAVGASGPIDILVNNAGNAGAEHSITDPTPFWQTTPDQWGPWLGTNLFGVLNCSRAVLPGMVERAFGRIINVISDAGRVGEPNLIVYSAAKAGAAGFTRALAKAVGRHGITANCVALSSMRTPATEELLRQPEVEKKMLRSYAIKRLGEPSDASALVLHLASAAGEWITGQTYPVNGGYAMAV